MVIYNCFLCNFTTNIKTNYNTHLNTKKHNNNEQIHQASKKEKSTKEHNSPKKVAQKSTKLSQNVNCDFCNLKFKTKANMRRHIKNYCKKINESDIIVLDNKVNDIEYALKFQQNQHEKEKKFLYKQIELLLGKVGNTTINNTNNIQLNNYGNEDLSHITDKLKNELVKIPYGMIPKLIEEVHFNNKKPENMNISLINKKDNKIKIFNGDKWIYKNKDETITDLLDGKYFILDSYYESIYDNLSKSKKINYEKFRINYDDKDKKLIEKLKEECELILLNNR